MCRGDTTLITFHWDMDGDIKLPQPDFTLPHTCINWDDFTRKAQQRAINAFEEGMLVHPKLG